MRIHELTLEVRDRTLKRVGQITPLFMSMSARTRWCNVGEWSVTLPGNHAMVAHLSTPGSGVILLGPSGTSDDVIFSGPTRMPKRVRNQENPDGTFTFSGVTDEIILQGARAFPQPSNADPTTQNVANDVRTGVTETLLREFVAANLVPGTAPAGRLRGLRSMLALGGADLGRGLTQTKSPRFQNMLELLQEMIAYDPDLGFRMVQVGDSIEFQVLDARDRSAFVRFDVDNGTLTSEETAIAAPTATDIIVAGQGEGTERMIVQRRDATAISQEADWGVPVEVFVDQRDVDNSTELEQKGDERLIEGRGGTSAKMTPADDTTMRVGHDWRLGDVVTAVIADGEPVARVSEIAYIASADGVRAAAALGDVSGFTQADSESSKVVSLDQRVSNLERASAAPVEIEWADITDPPATFPPSAHSHNASDVTAGTFAAARLPAATETAAGAVERATTAEVQAGTDSTRYVDPADLASVVGIGTGYRFQTTQLISSSTTWNRPAGCRAIRVRAQAGGGAGGGAPAATTGQHASGGGGGGGGYAERFIENPDASYAVTIGNGGTPGSAGSAGGDGGATNFGSVVQTSGGGGGGIAGSSALTVAAIGGDGGTGDIAGADGLKVPGQPGGLGGGGATLGLGGQGGGSYLGGGGKASYTGAGSGGITGADGVIWGGGGAGGSTNAGASARQGGAGAKGVVLVDIFI